MARPQTRTEAHPLEGVRAALARSPEAHARLRRLLRAVEDTHARVAGATSPEDARGPLRELRAACLRLGKAVRDGGNEALAAREFLSQGLRRLVREERAIQRSLTATAVRICGEAVSRRSLAGMKIRLTSVVHTLTHFESALMLRRERVLLPMVAEMLSSPPLRQPCTRMSPHVAAGAVTDGASSVLRATTKGP